MNGESMGLQSCIKASLPTLAHLLHKGMHPVMSYITDRHSIASTSTLHLSGSRQTRLTIRASGIQKGIASEENEHSN